MTHRIDKHDVDAAFARYKAISGDEGAELRRITAGTLTIYRLEGFLEGSWFGALATYSVLDSYCKGYIDGREASAAASLRDP